jgi:tRNA(Arg) A34 adenosine deaminase TadA
VDKVLLKAIDLAKAMDKAMGKHRVCAIITNKKGRIISVAVNSYSKTSPFMYKYAKQVGLDDKIYWHAECKAIKQLADTHHAHKIYIARVSKSDKVGLAAPCPICAAAIKDAGIVSVEFTV